MTSTIFPNIILCSAVFVAVVAPLVWAILTAQHDQSEATRATRREPHPRPSDRHGLTGARVRQPVRPHAS